MDEKSLVPVEQKEIEFYGDGLIAIRATDSQIYVSVRHLADALGLTRQSQVRRISRQPVLNDGHFKGAMMTPKGARDANWLRVDLVPLWLSGIDTTRVKDEIRPKLEKYQREAAKVLWEAFQDGRLTTEPSFDDLLATDSPAAQAYRMATAIMQMARQQLMLESQVKSHTLLLSDFEKRLEQVESTLGDPGHHVSPDQAMQISQAVKAIAMVMSKASGSNQYGSVYGELYRKFGITSYKMLPANRFDEAMKFLTDWHQELVGDVPF